MHRFTFALSEPAYVSVNRALGWATYRRWLLWALGFLILGLATIGVAVFSDVDWQHSILRKVVVIIFALSFGCVGGAIGGMARLPSRARAAFREQPLMGASKAVELSEAGLHVTDGKSESNLGWNDVIKWQLLADHLVLYVTRFTFFAFPLAEIGTAGTDFALEMLRNAGLPVAGKTRKA